MKRAIKAANKRYRQLQKHFPLMLNCAAFGGYSERAKFVIRFHPSDFGKARAEQEQTRIEDFLEEPVEFVIDDNIEAPPSAPPPTDK